MADQSEQSEFRSLELVSSELGSHLDRASSALERLKVQQDAYSSLLSQFQSYLNAARALSR